MAALGGRPSSPRRIAIPIGPSRNVGSPTRSSPRRIRGESNVTLIPRTVQSAGPSRRAHVAGSRACLSSRGRSGFSSSPAFSVRKDEGAMSLLIEVHPGRSVMVAASRRVQGPAEAPSNRTWNSLDHRQLLAVTFTGNVSSRFPRYNATTGVVDIEDTGNLTPPVTYVVLGTQKNPTVPHDHPGQHPAIRPRRL